MGQRQRIRERQSEPECLSYEPLHIPGMDQPLTLREEMQRFIRQQISQIAQANNLGSFEDEDDFEEEDPDPDLTSPYSVTEMMPIGEQPAQDLDGTPDPEPPPADNAPDSTLDNQPLAPE